MVYLKDKIITALTERAEEAKKHGIPQFVMGLNDAIDIVERTYEDWEKNICADCGKEEKNPGLDICGPCYHKRIWGDH